MNENFSKIKKICGGTKNFFLSLAYNPKRGWILVLIFLFVGLVGVACWSGYLFSKVNSKEFLVSDQNFGEDALSVNSMDLKKIMDSFKEKEFRFNSFLNSKNTFIDPSL